MPGIACVRRSPILNLALTNSGIAHNYSRSRSSLFHFAALLVFCLAAGAAFAQTFKVLDPNGGSAAPLIQGLDGNLYGILNFTSGTYGTGGSVVRVSPTGKSSTLYTFCSQPNCADGQSPNGV